MQGLRCLTGPSRVASDVPIAAATWIGSALNVTLSIPHLQTMLITVQRSDNQLLELKNLQNTTPSY